MLRLYLFGAPRIECDGRPIVLRRSKGMALLAYLAASRRPQERETLLDLLWPEFDQASARNNLRRELSLLRGALGEDTLRTDGQQVAVAPDGQIWLDLAAFEQQLDAARRLPPASEAWAEALGCAADIAADEFMAGFSLPESERFAEWQFFQRESLRQQLAETLEALVRWHIGRADSPGGPALPLARRWLALDPLHEPARRALMELYARAGQTAAALRCFEEGARLLADELGAEPEAETQALYQAIKARQLGRRPATPAQPTVGAAPVPGPTDTGAGPPLTSFVGRQRELQELAERLRDPACRLLTLVGPGGVGKTRLAMELAARRGPDFADGALFVSLQGATTPAHIPAAVAGAMGMSLAGSGDHWDRLADLLRGREQLLLLDNFEQLLDGAPQLAELLRAAPRLQILVTSREALRLQEEWRYPVEGLDLPEATDEGGASEASAVQLFIARAHQASPCAIQPAELDAVARICRMVGGMPLAIELAAAWTATLSCAEIAAEIERDLAFLETSLRNVPPRHRSIAIIFDQTWARLEPEARRALMALSVFPGGFTRQAAAAVAGATPALLAGLLDRALLRRGSDGRYGFHELVRQDVARRLAADSVEAARVRAACGRYYAKLLYDLRLRAESGEKRAVIALVEAERENIRGAWPALLEQAAGEQLRQLLQGLHSFYLIRGPYQEGIELLEAAEAKLRAAGDQREARHVLAHLLTSLGFLNIRVGDIARAVGRFAESGAIFAELGLPPLPGDATDPEIGQGIIALIRGDYPAASQHAERLRARSEAHGLLSNQAYAWYLLTEAALAQRLLPAALRSARRALDAARAARSEWFSAYILNQLGQIAMGLGQLDEADAHFRACYAIREAFGDMEGMALALVGQGESAARRQDYAGAARLYRQALGLYERIGDRGGTASALVGLGAAESALGRTPQAWAHLRRALELALALDYQHVVLDIVTHAAQLLIGAGRAEEGLELLATALLHPASRGETSERAQRLVLRCEQTMPAATFDAALERGRYQPLAAAIERLLALAEAGAAEPALPRSVLALVGA